MNCLLDHLWPFSEIRSLRRQRDTVNRHFVRQLEFGKACVAYLDAVHAPWKHTQLNGKLYIMDTNTASVMERGAADVIYWLDAEDGVQEFRAVSSVEFVENPRMNWKVEGFDA